MSWEQKYSQLCAHTNHCQGENLQPGSSADSGLFRPHLELCHILGSALYRRFPEKGIQDEELPRSQALEET